MATRLPPRHSQPFNDKQVGFRTIGQVLPAASVVQPALAGGCSNGPSLLRRMRSSTRLAKYGNKWATINDSMSNAMYSALAPNDD
ncbi:hypothetical protein ACFXTO_048028 [Malus domestica]